MKHVTLKELLADEPQYKITVMDKIKSFMTNGYYTIRNFFKYKVAGWFSGFDKRECWNLDSTLVSFTISFINKKLKKSKIDFKDILNTFSKYTSDQFDMVSYTGSSKFHNEFNESLDKLVDIVKDLGEDIQPFETYLRKYLSVRLQYLKDTTHGYPEYSIERLKPLDLEYLIGKDCEDTWNKILDELIKHLGIFTKESRDKASYILSKILMDLWD